MIEIPAHYPSLTPKERRLTRGKYVNLQGGLCAYKECRAPLDGLPHIRVVEKAVRPFLYPKNFFSNPIHLHHDHKTGMTLGAVHCYGNAVLWEYHGE